MEIFIQVKEKKDLPKMDQLVQVMWEKGINLSKIGSQNSLEKNESLTLSWDKWLDDKRWDTHPKFKDYIHFDVNFVNGFYCLSIECEEDVCFVDRRAVHKAVFFIAKKANALISLNQKNWMKLDDYCLLVDKYLSTSFEEAVEKSLLEK